MICNRCKKNIDGGHVVVNGLHFHLDCFYCESCGRHIQSRFLQDGSALYHPECITKVAGPICSYCHGKLDESYIESDEKKYHPLCYENHIQPHCRICGQKITGRYVTDTEGDYHSECFKNVKLQKCDVCGLPLEGKYLADQWGNKSHTQHDGRELIFCSSCSRIISERTSGSGVRYRDGRAICNLCRKVAVDKEADVGESIKDVRSFLIKLGFIAIPTDITIRVLSREKLIERLPIDKGDDSRGLAHSEISYSGLKRTLSHTIYILAGMPRVEFEGVLAHEMLHVWLNEHDIKMTAAETEGLCNLGSYLIYKKSGTDHAGLLIRQMDNSKDPIYGEGYRDIRQRMEKLGMKRFLTNILGG